MANYEDIIFISQLNKITAMWNLDFKTTKTSVQSMSYLKI